MLYYARKGVGFGASAAVNDERCAHHLPSLLSTKLARRGPAAPAGEPQGLSVDEEFAVAVVGTGRPRETSGRLRKSC